MKNFIILVLFAGLFVTASSVSAQSDSQKSKSPAKVETTVNKADTPEAAKACCAKKEAKAGETKACAEKKEACPKSGEKKACCAEKKADAKAPDSSCTNKDASKEAKSCGKKAN